MKVEQSHGEVAQGNLIELYDDLLAEMNCERLIHYDGINVSSGHLYLLRIPEIDVEARNRIIVKLAEQGITTNVHYKPLPMLSAYRNLGFHIQDYPNAYAQFQNEITLPLHTMLSVDDVAYICEHIGECIKSI